MIKSTFRGHCQICGRLQAVRGDRIVKHGYKVTEYFGFAGVCSGSDKAPLETDRAELRAFTVRAEASAEAAAQQAARIRSGEQTIKFTKVGAYNPRAFRSEIIEVRREELSAYEQAQQIARAAADVERQARVFREHLRTMTALADRVHGQPLKGVAA